MSLVDQGLPLKKPHQLCPIRGLRAMDPGNYLQWPAGEGHACPGALRQIGVGSLTHQFATVTVPGLSHWYLIIGFKPAHDPLGKASRNLSMVQRAPRLRRGPVLYGDLRLAYSGHLCTNQAAVFRVLAINEIRSAWPSLNGRHGDPWDCPQRSGLSLTQKKKNPVRYGVISKEPADSTCLHPGVPNCSTMSP